MSQEITQYKLSNADIETLVQVGVIPKDTPPSAISMYSKFCAESNLSPFKKQVHLVKRWTKDGDRYTIQTGIDGYRAIANRTGQYAGNDDYRFDEGLTEYEAVKNNRNPPTTATATVYRIVSGVRCPFSSTARWDEYVQMFKKDGKEIVSAMWAKMPYLMLGKCAEALALRKAFPEEIGGVYTDEEMQQADVVLVEKQQMQSGKAPIEVQEAVVVEKKAPDFADETEKRSKALTAISKATASLTLGKIQAQVEKYYREGLFSEEVYGELSNEITKKSLEITPLGEK